MQSCLSFVFVPRFGFRIQSSSQSFSQSESQPAIHLLAYSLSMRRTRLPSVRLSCTPPLPSLLPLLSCECNCILFEANPPLPLSSFPLVIIYYPPRLIGLSLQRRMFPASESFLLPSFGTSTLLFLCSDSSPSCCCWLRLVLSLCLPSLSMSQCF